MKQRLLNILPIIVIGMVMVFGGAFITGHALAQAGLPDCNNPTTNTAFSGWIMCWIGNPSAGIPGAPTLFAGQKAIYDRIGTISSGPSGGGGGHEIWLERANGSPATIGTDGWPNAFPIGRMTDHTSADFSDTGYFDFTNSSITGGNDFNTAGGFIQFMFVPNANFQNMLKITPPPVAFSGAQSHSIKPSLCVVRQESMSATTQSNAMRPLRRIGVQCAYPPLCQGATESSTNTNSPANCLKPSERTGPTWEYTDSSSESSNIYRRSSDGSFTEYLPHNQFHILVK